MGVCGVVECSSTASPKYYMTYKIVNNCIRNTRVVHICYENNYIWRHALYIRLVIFYFYFNCTTAICVYSEMMIYCIVWITKLLLCYIILISRDIFVTVFFQKAHKFSLLWLSSVNHLDPYISILTDYGFFAFWAQFAKAIRVIIYIAQATTHSSWLRLNCF